MKKAAEEKYDGPLTQDSSPATRLESGDVLATADDHELHSQADGAADDEQLDHLEDLTHG